LPCIHVCVLNEGGRVEVLIKCGTCLQELHNIEIVHRDVKPENFLMRKLEEDCDHVVLSDFGLSTSSTTEKTQARNCCGTISYKAPEIALNNKHLKSAGSKVYRKMLNNAYRLTHLGGHKRKHK
jgi:serine/threonine protein kinase